MTDTHVQKRPRLSPPTLTSGNGDGDGDAEMRPPPLPSSAFNKRSLLPPQSSSNAGTATGEDDREDDEEMTEADRVLETFRKEAIYREMISYRSSYQRSLAMVEQLESDKKELQDRAKLVEVEWALIVKEAERVLPPPASSSSDIILSLTTSSSSPQSLTALSSTLTTLSNSTLSLLSRLHSLPPSPSPQSQDLRAQLSSLQAQLVSLQSTLHTLEKEREDMKALLERLEEELKSKERRWVRWRSRSVARMEGREISVAAAGKEKGLPNGIHSPTTIASPPNSSNTPASTNNNNYISFAHPLVPGADEDHRSLAESRLREIEDLRNERVNLKMDIDALKAKLIELPDAIVAESIPFRLLQGHVQTMTSEYEVKKSELEKLGKEAEELREGREGWREAILKEANLEITSLTTRLVSRESDLTRIRSQREDVRAEALELKARESEKVRNLDQVKDLAQSRESRIRAFEKENRRLKMLLAAERGESAVVEAYEGGEEEEEIVRKLQERVKTTEEILLALRDQVQGYSSNRGSFDSRTLAESETQARLALQQAREKLATLESLLGSGDLGELASRLKEVEERNKILEMKVKASEQASEMLYAEIDQLSSAWTSLDEQCANKVFGLVSLEEKVQRLNSEKAKSDNRYFATMRQKDAIAAENAVLTKLAEKQQRAVEAANEMHHSVGAQLTAAEQEISFQQRNVRAYQDSLAQIKRENSELVMRAEGNAKHIAELNSLLADRVSQAESAMAGRQRSEEEASRLDRELKAVRANSNPAGSSGGADDSSEVRELKKYNEDLSKMLKCSTCALRFKGVIINRCGHLFCKECIDARLANRQRKCPTCGVAFGKDDVANVYF